MFGKALIAVISSLFISVVALAANSFAPLTKVLSVYQKKQTVEMSVVKTLEAELLGKKSIHEGYIWLSKGKFRWETNKPEKSLLLSDGSQLFSVQYPDEALGGKVQVAKTDVSKKGMNQLLLSTVMNVGGAEKHFSLMKSLMDGELVSLYLKPKTKDFTISDLTIVVDTKKQKITKVEYKDELGNKTTLVFGPVYFDKSANKPELFKFKIPKDAQVTEL